MRTIATWLIAALLCCGVARAADTVFVKDSSENNGGLGLLVPSDENTGNQSPSNNWIAKNDNSSVSSQPNQPYDAAGKSARSPAPNTRMTAGFVNAMRRTLAADNNHAVWSPMLRQPWTIALIVLGWLVVAIVPALRVTRWMRTRRAHGRRGALRSRSSAPSILAANLVQTQLRRHESVRKPESEERKKPRRAA